VCTVPAAGVSASDGGGSSGRISKFGETRSETRMNFEGIKRRSGRVGAKSNGECDHPARIVLTGFSGTGKRGCIYSRRRAAGTWRTRMRWSTLRQYLDIFRSTARTLSRP
jgi:hypothetical protein